MKPRKVGGSNERRDDGFVSALNSDPCMSPAY
jgi:hypothetical protein